MRKLGSWLYRVATWPLRVWVWFPWGRGATWSVVGWTACFLLSWEVALYAACERAVFLDAVCRWTAMLLQLLGLAGVAWGIVETRKVFSYKSLRELVIEKFQNFPWPPSGRVISHDVTVSAHGTSAVAGGAIAAIVNEPQPSLEERLARLETAFKNEKIATATRFEQERAERLAALEREASARRSGDNRVARQLEDAVAGGIHLEAIGVAWLLVGTLIAGVAADAQRTFDRHLGPAAFPITCYTLVRR